MKTLIERIDAVLDPVRGEMTGGPQKGLHGYDLTFDLPVAMYHSDVQDNIVAKGEEMGLYYVGGGTSFSGGGSDMQFEGSLRNCEQFSAWLSTVRGIRNVKLEPLDDE